MRAIRARYNPYLQTRHRVEQVSCLVISHMAVHRLHLYHLHYHRLHLF